MRNENFRFSRESVRISKENVHVSRGGVRVAVFYNNYIINIIF